MLGEREYQNVVITFSLENMTNERSGRKCCYIWDEKLIQQCDRLPAVLGRASMVHKLIVAYDITSNLTIVNSSLASYEDLKKFHSEIYLDHIKQFSDVDDDYMTTTQDEELGIGYDCPPVSGLFDLVSTIAGGSITAAKCLVLGLTDVAINWCGGWHHAQRFGAEGFCYVNDIVLAIDTLKQKFPKVLYIDLDVHHGNGVQDAYNLSKSVFTLSFHKYEPGFYPGTGNVDDIGTLVGKGYACNFPLHAYYSDDTLEYAFKHVFEEIYSQFSPDAIVVQCGADALARDPHGGAALTEKSYLTCTRFVLDKRKPTLLLGGGGYNFPNAARLWTSITAVASNMQLDDNIPEHINWPKYGPDYMLHIEPPLAKDCNTKSYLDGCIKTIADQINKYLMESKNEEPALKIQKINSNVQVMVQNENANCHKTNENHSAIRNNINIEKTVNALPKATSTNVYDFVD